MPMRGICMYLSSFGAPQIFERLTCSEVYSSFQRPKSDDYKGDPWRFICAPARLLLLGACLHCLGFLGIASGMNEMSELAMLRSNKRQDNFLEERLLGL